MIRFGIVGCGHIAHRHAQHILDHGEAELRSVFDIRPERASDFAVKHGTHAAGTLDELLMDPELDIVNVCTPNGHHCDVALQCLSSGKHILVEKPMAISRLSCERMVDRALKQNRQLFVVKQNRFNPPVEALKELLEGQALGEVYLVVVNCFWNRNARYYEDSDWKGTRDLDGGTLFTQFSHFVDVMYYLFGDVTNIQGSVVNASHQGLIEFEDTGVFTFRFLDGAMGSLSYTTSCYEKNYEGSITVFAEKGTVKVGGKYLNVVDYQLTQGGEMADVPAIERPNDYGYYEGSMSNHDKVIANVIDALQDRSRIKTSALEGMKVVEIIERMYAVAAASERAGRP